MWLAVSNHRSHASLGVEARDPGATGAHAFCQRALRREFQLQLAAHVLALKLSVLPDITGDHLANLPGLQQEPKPPVINASIVGDAGQLAGAGIPERHDEVLRNAAQAESAHRNAHAILDDACKRARW